MAPETVVETIRLVTSSPLTLVPSLRAIMKSMGLPEPASVKS